MPSTISPRRQPCTHCGDTVLLVESARSALGGLFKLRAVATVQHADPAPSGEIDDGVDAACRRTPVV